MFKYNKGNYNYKFVSAYNLTNNNIYKHRLI
jgi:hypothetical protein